MSFFKMQRIIRPFRVLVSDLVRRPSLYLFVVIIIYSIDRHNRLQHRISPHAPFYSDVLEYYRYLPDVFINDWSVSKPRILENKRTVGMAILYAPFFFAAHIYTLSNGLEANGYSLPYRDAVRFGSLLYCLIGLFVLRRSLLKVYSEKLVTLTIVVVLFATNLFYYSYGWGAMPHSYLFFLYALFIHETIQWTVYLQKKNFMRLSLIGGFCVLIRPTAIFIMLFPLLYDVYSTEGLKTRIRNIFSESTVVIKGLVMFSTPFLFQCVIWLLLHGEFWYYSYGDERFFFNDPQIVNFLFSFRKGWLVYTPVMFLALIGVFFARPPDSTKLFCIVFFPVTVFVLSSWWTWSYDGSFGSRVMVESYTFLAFPLTGLFARVFDTPNTYGALFLKILVFTFLIGAIRINLKLTYFYRAGLVHWSGMNYHTLEYVMKLKTFDSTDYRYLNARFTPPDLDQMKTGKRDQ